MAFSRSVSLGSVVTNSFCLGGARGFHLQFNLPRRAAETSYYRMDPYQKKTKKPFEPGWLSCRPASQPAGMIFAFWQEILEPTRTESNSHEFLRQKVHRINSALYLREDRRFFAGEKAPPRRQRRYSRAFFSVHCLSLSSAR